MAERLPWSEMWQSYSQQLGEARENYASELERLYRLPGLSESARLSRADELQSQYQQELETIQGGELGRRLNSRYESERDATISYFDPSMLGPDNDNGLIGAMAERPGEAAGQSFEAWLKPTGSLPWRSRSPSPLTVAPTWIQPPQVMP